MRIISTSLLTLAALSLAGCERSTPMQPERALALAASADKHDGKPEIDPTYANGKTVYMIGPHAVENARATMPNLYEKAEELYLVVYPSGTPNAPITLPSGYQPQCNPCFHPGLPAPFVHHDHVITGAPGMGNNGTAGEFKSPWKLIVLMYRSDYVASPTFTPIKSATDLDAAEAAGNVFVQLAPGAPNPYEIDTGNLLICPIVSSHA